MAAFAYNHPQFISPKVNEGNFSLEIKQGDHPLLNAKENTFKCPNLKHNK